MPIYEYECPECKHVFEKKQGFAEAACAECPACQTKAKRIFRPVPIIFKGSGFYVTDHGKSSSSSAPQKSQETAQKGK
ncbi:MAG: FmdB family zinc ribbon protein [Dehalococcoidales bacterium]|jgi:putative FmdB family regulatory protein